MMKIKIFSLVFGMMLLASSFSFGQVHADFTADITEQMTFFAIFKNSLAKNLDGGYF